MTLKAEEGDYEPTEAEQYVLDHVPEAYEDGLELKAPPADFVCREIPPNPPFIKGGNLSEKL
jgi:hypothetical protein